jgi:hypothetical protein
MTKIAGSGSLIRRHGSADLGPDPDSHQNVMDPQTQVVTTNKKEILHLGQVTAANGALVPRAEHAHPDGAGVAHRVVALTHAEDLYPEHRHAIKDSGVNRTSRSTNCGYGSSYGYGSGWRRRGTSGSALE